MTDLSWIDKLYFDLFDNSDRKKLYEDHRTQKLRLNRDPDRLFKRYREYFPDEVSLSDVVDVLRAHYTAALAAHRTVRYKEHFGKEQIHPHVVKVLRQKLHRSSGLSQNFDSECCRAIARVDDRKRHFPGRTSSLSLMT